MRRHLKEVTILDISDWHGQLPPLTEAPDNSVPPSPTFAIGGAAFLKKWFELYEAEAGGAGRRDRDGRR